MKKNLSVQRPLLLSRIMVSIVAIGCLFYVSSCQRDADFARPTTVSELVTLSGRNTNFVSLDEAKRAALQFDHSSKSSPPVVIVQSVSTAPISALSTNDLPVNRSIESITPYPNVGNPSYYIINYAKTGFIILAADKRVEPILAYSDRNQFRVANDMPEGLATWLTKNHQNMQTLRRDTSLKRPPVIAYLWEKLLADSSLVIRTAQTTITPVSEPRPNVQQPPPAPCQNFDYPTKTYGPLLGVEWGQGCTYNDYCPSGNGCGSHVVTGCVPTAIAQIAQLTHLPAGYSYTSMPTHSGNDDVAHLMRNIGSIVGTIYTTTNESQTPGSDYTSGLRSMGYSAAAFGTYDYNTLANNIYNGWPVLLNGYQSASTAYGHTWVCDGIQVQSSFNCDCQCTFRLQYMHMNWGWNETFTSQNGNGWFYQNNWTVTNDSGTYNYQYNNSMNYNLHQ